MLLMVEKDIRGGIFHSKIRDTQNKPIYLGLSIPELSKMLMQ